MSAGKFVGEGITAAVLRLNPFGPEGYARRDRNKAYRKARKKARRGETLTEQELQILNQPQEGSMAGYKTYSGIAVALIGVVLGWLGVGETEAGTLSAQIGSAIDQVITVAGLLLAAYGRAKAKPAA